MRYVTILEASVVGEKGGRGEGGGVVLEMEGWFVGLGEIEARRWEVCLLMRVECVERRLW